MTRLTVFYDGQCGLCCAVRDWVARQDTFLPVEWRPKPDDMEELVVVADSGEMWSGDTAWLMVLWATVDYRDWSYRLASPALLPAARTMFAQLSKHRGAISCGLGLTSGSGEAIDLHGQ
jgi:predicted DCC family thiol-disulfide oxidoreductase YuxK